MRGMGRSQGWSVARLLRCFVPGGDGVGFGGVEAADGLDAAVAAGVERNHAERLRDGDAVVEHLSERKRNPEKVRNLFKKAEVRYAAADTKDKV